MRRRCRTHRLGNLIKPYRSFPRPSHKEHLRGRAKSSRSRSERSKPEMNDWVSYSAPYRHLSVQLETLTSQNCDATRRGPPMHASGSLRYSSIAAHWHSFLLASSRNLSYHRKIKRAIPVPTPTNDHSASV